MGCTLLQKADPKSGKTKRKRGICKEFLAFFLMHKARIKGTLAPQKHLVDEDKKSDYNYRRSNRGALQKSSFVPLGKAGQSERQERRNPR